MIRLILAFVAFGLSYYLWQEPLPKQLRVYESYQDYVLWSCLAIGLYCLLSFRPKPQAKSVCRLKGFNWDLNDFCRGWLITGKTGSGKTASAIAHILHQLFQRVKPEKGLKHWGGVAVDQKGNFFKIIEDIAGNYQQSERLVTLQVRPQNAPKNWKAKYKYNLLSYPGIPASTYAKIIIDTAASLGQDSGGGSSSFFKTQAQLHIEKAIELLQLIKEIKESPESMSFDLSLNRNVEEGASFSDYDFYKNVMPSYSSLKNIYVFLTDKDLLGKVCNFLAIVKDSGCFKEQKELLKKVGILQTHFQVKFLGQPVDQLGGVIGTIYNYLGFFTSDDICEVFCAEHNTVEFEQVDEGYIFSVAMPQRFQSERTYVNTLMKLIYYTHALRRFDNPDKLKGNNLLLFIADEAQGVVTASKDGMTDYTVIDKIREARATVLFAAQSTTSFLPVMKKEQVDTLLLNLANQVHYTVADENNAKLIADVIGKKEQMKKSRGFSGGKASYNYQPDRRTHHKALCTSSDEEVRVCPHSL